MRSDDHPPAERLRIAVMYYSARGNVHGLARDVAEGAASVGVEVRLRHVAELNQELLISAKQYWGRHRSEIEHEPDARLEDIEWADGIAFGTPTRVRHTVHEVFNGGENPSGASFTESIHADQRGARHLSQEGRSAPKPSSCSQLPDDPASARATRRSD